MHGMLNLEHSLSAQWRERQLFSQGGSNPEETKKSSEWLVNTGWKNVAGTPCC